VGFGAHLCSHRHFRRTCVEITRCEHVRVYLMFTRFRSSTSCAHMHYESTSRHRTIQELYQITHINRVLVVTGHGVLKHFVSPYYMVRIHIGCRGASLTFDVGVMFSSQWVWMWCRPLQGFSVVSGVLSYAGLVTTIRLSFPPWSENVHTVQLFSAFEHHFIWGWWLQAHRRTSPYGGWLTFHTRRPNEMVHIYMDKLGVLRTQVAVCHIIQKTRQFRRR
jgi:hypothetical protein